MPLEGVALGRKGREDGKEVKSQHASSMRPGSATPLMGSGVCPSPGLWGGRARTGDGAVCGERLGPGSTDAPVWRPPWQPAPQQRLWWGVPQEGL